MADWQHWDWSELLTSMTPVKHMCILKQEKNDPHFSLSPSGMIAQLRDSCEAHSQPSHGGEFGNSFIADKTVQNKHAVVSVYPEITPVLE